MAQNSFTNQMQELMSTRCPVTGEKNISIKLTEYLQKPQSQAPQIQKTWETLQSDFCKMIFSSNFIEHAGLYQLPPQITNDIRKKAFDGEEFDNINFLPYARAVASMQDILEVFQHAQAFQFLVQKIIFQNEDFSEELFLEAHRILHRNIPHPDGEDIAGVIRTHRVGARSNGKGVQFTPPAGIPFLMKALFEDLNNDIQQASFVGAIDPYDLAARYCHRFVNIHPFSDGNGRVCRLLLNTILLKYAGHVVFFGGDEDGREEYLRIAHDGAKVSRREEQWEVREDERVAHRELAVLVLLTSKAQETSENL